jgi:hypothetical protein
MITLMAFSVKRSNMAVFHPLLPVSLNLNTVNLAIGNSCLAHQVR